MNPIKKDISFHLTNYHVWIDGEDHNDYFQGLYPTHAVEAFAEANKYKFDVNRPIRVIVSDRITEWGFDVTMRPSYDIDEVWKEDAAKNEAFDKADADIIQ